MHNVKSGSTAYGGGRVGAALDWGAVIVRDKHRTEIQAVPLRKQNVRIGAALLCLGKAAYVLRENGSTVARRLQ